MDVQVNGVTISGIRFPFDSWVILDILSTISDDDSLNTLAVGLRSIIETNISYQYSRNGAPTNASLTLNTQITLGGTPEMPVSIRKVYYEDVEGSPPPSDEYTSFPAG